MIRAALCLSFCLAAAPVAADCRFTLNFPFASAEVQLADLLLLRRVAQHHPGGPFVISAHADDEGTAPQNLAMSEARARAVISALREAGAGPAAVAQALAAGEWWPAVPTDAPNPLNRRVELFTPDCDHALFPEARRVDGPGLETLGRQVAVLPPLPLVLD